MSGELPVGKPLEWRRARRPVREPLRGQRVLLRAVDPATDAEALYEAIHPPVAEPGLWTYLPDGPYRDPAHLREMLEAIAAIDDPSYYTVVPHASQRPAGLLAYMRIAPEMGVIEIGSIRFGALLKRTTAATETIYLMARHAFEALGYRRLEWKCDSLNAASRKAAERFGFRFEGIFRQHMVVKGRNRDTAWYSITDREWPSVGSAFERWLDDGNFDSDGRQRRRLGELMSESRARH